MGSDFRPSRWEPRGQVPRKGAPKLDPACQSPRFRVPDTFADSPRALPPARALAGQGPNSVPPLPPALLLSTTFPSSFPSLFRPGLGLGACASANTPRPSDRAALRGEGPEAPLPDCGRRGQRRSPRWERGGRGPAPRPARSGHSAHWSGGQEAGLAERGVPAGQVRALAGPGRAPGAGSQVTAPRGAGGGPRFGPVHQPPVGPGAYNGRRGGEKTQSAAGLPGLLPPPPAPRASCMRAR